MKSLGSTETFLPLYLVGKSLEKIFSLILRKDLQIFAAMAQPIYSIVEGQVSD